MKKDEEVKRGTKVGEKNFFFPFSYLILKLFTLKILIFGNSHMSSSKLLSFSLNFSLAISYQAYSPHDSYL